MEAQRKPQSRQQKAGPAGPHDHYPGTHPSGLPSSIMVLIKAAV